MDWIRIFDSAQTMQEQLQPRIPRLLVVRQKRLCLVFHNNQLKAVQDACPHNGESLSKGKLNYMGEIICPWHEYRFELNTGRESAERCRDLETFPVKINEEGVFIGL